MGIPNIITSLRLIIIPPFLYSYIFIPEYGEKIALALLVFSGVTDMLDGYIARKFNQETKLGALLDPLADKMLLVTVLSVFAIKNKIGQWMLISMVIKEFIMILGAYMLYTDKGDVIEANIFGKVSTIIFYIASLFIMMGVEFGSLIMVVFILFNILSLLIYFLRFISIKKAA